MANAQAAGQTAEQLAEDEDYWAQISRAFTVSPHFINLESGYYSLAADPVLEGMIAETKAANREAAYYMRTLQFDDLERLREQLAEEVGCHPETLALCATPPRHSTSSFQG